jgi:hypothetical protein
VIPTITLISEGGLKMKLEVMERVLLIGLLPVEEDFLTLKLLRTVKENLSFDDKEHKKLGFKAEQGMTLWNQEAAKDIVKDVPMGEIVTQLIVKKLKELDKEKKLKAEHISLYEKFIEGKTDDDSEEKENRGKEEGNSEQSK